MEAVLETPTHTPTLQGRYTGEPCRICGELIHHEDVPVFAGYCRKGVTRATHRDCWEDRGLEHTWVHP